MQPAMPDPNLLREMITTKMPFGKYSGRMITQLPVTYLEWFERKGFPPGKLGMMLSTMYIIKTNGLEEILKPIIQNQYR